MGWKILIIILDHINRKKYISQGIYIIYICVLCRLHIRSRSFVPVSRAACIEDRDDVRLVRAMLKSFWRAFLMLGDLIIMKENHQSIYDWMELTFNLRIAPVGRFGQLHIAVFDLLGDISDCLSTRKIISMRFWWFGNIYDFRCYITPSCLANLFFKTCNLCFLWVFAIIIILLCFLTSLTSSVS